MFVQIAPHVKVFLTKEQIAFVEKYQFVESFTDIEKARDFIKGTNYMIWHHNSEVH